MVRCVRARLLPIVKKPEANGGLGLTSCTGWLESLDPLKITDNTLLLAWGSPTLPLVVFGCQIQSVVWLFCVWARWRYRTLGLLWVEMRLAVGLLRTLGTCGFKRRAWGAIKPRVPQVSGRVLENCARGMG